MSRWIRWVSALGVVCIEVGLAAVPAAATVVPEQTPVKVKLLQRLKSGHDRKGDRVRFVVAADVRGPDHTLLIARGTSVVGTVIRSTSRRMFGQPGRLEFTIDYIKMGEGQRVPLRTTATAAKGHSNTAATVAGAVLLAPIAVLVKGSDVEVKEGTEYSVFVDQATAVPGPLALARAADPTGPPSAQLCLFHLKDGRTISGVLESFRAGTYYVGTDLGRLQISQDKVESISAGP